MKFCKAGRPQALLLILVAVITMIVVDQLHAKKHKPTKNAGRRQKYLLLGIIAPMLAGVATSLEKPALVAMTVMVYAAIGWGLQGLLLMISA